MGFIERELSRIESALGKSSEGDAKYDQLYVAQQALKWATEPQGFAAPLDIIVLPAGDRQPATGTPAAPAGCLDEGRQPPSSDTRDLHASR